MQHQRQVQPCQWNELARVEGFSQGQKRELKRKTRGSEPEKWHEIYKTLFPEVPLEAIPTPCMPILDSWKATTDLRENVDYDYSTYTPMRQVINSSIVRVAQDENARRDFQHLLHRRLETAVDEIWQNAKKTLRAQVPSIAENVHIELHQTPPSALSFETPPLNRLIGSQIPRGPTSQKAEALPAPEPITPQVVRPNVPPASEQQDDKIAANAGTAYGTTQVFSLREASFKSVPTVETAVSPTILDSARASAEIAWEDAWPDVDFQTLLNITDEQIAELYRKDT